jgi:hypothetical protein
MRLSWVLLLPAALPWLGGCHGSLLFWKKPPPLDVQATCAERGAPARPTERVSARVELQEARYDGKDLSGRLLISPVDGNLCLDKRLVTSFVLTTESVVECSTGRDLGVIIADVLAPRRQEEDVLVLKPGYWYGKDVSIFLYSEQLTGKPSPGCVEAEFTFHALNVTQAARLRVRVTRTAEPAPVAGAPATGAALAPGQPAPPP